jgi:hypothetical protein
MKTVFEDPARLKQMKRAGIFSLALLVVIDLLIPRDHAIFPWDGIPGFYATFGFLATAVIIVVSKVIGHLFLMKREDYYDH